ncbi:hypothetical protein ILUMI_26772 [Ignelater luminosus]|uniref:Uncharacterized protein n=1 Tax=Ignelater luminosus TaxID=2038154 RepID=A0A8K0C438_IGNLU|nr:hypothetical protein ILUMI_26772 [Ignelater luminosus]
MFSVKDRPRSGRPRETRTVKAVTERNRRNLLRKQKILAREMKIPPRTISRIIKEDLRLVAYHEKACFKPYRNIESLKADLVKVAASIPMEVVRTEIDESA